MVDTHYDLLSICYVCYLKNDYTKIEDISKQILNNDMKAIFANLYFMSLEEMKKELDPNYYNSNVSILEMFKISKRILKRYLPNIDFVYSIEGCDFLSIDDLEPLYDEGLRSIILVWNTENKYGSGNRTEKGLTEDGIKFLNKAIDLGIGIDLSHANKNTFYGMIEVIKENKKQGKDVICYASHSNSRKLCDRERNLTDLQLKEIKDVDGLVGVFSNRNFVTLDKSLSKDMEADLYLEHIIHIEEIVGKENVMLSTDDMKFCGEIDINYMNAPIFDYSNLETKVKNLLLKHYKVDDANKFLYENAYKKIINKLNIDRIKTNEK